MPEPELPADRGDEELSYSYRESWWARARAAFTRRTPQDGEGPGGR